MFTKLFHTRLTLATVDAGFVLAPFNTLAMVLNNSVCHFVTSWTMVIL